MFINRVMAPATLWDRIKLTEATTPDGQLAYACSRHGYWCGEASGAPPSSCEECWAIYYHRLLSVLDPATRERLKENLTRVVVAIDSLSRSGDFDLRIRRHPKVENLDLDRDEPVILGSNIDTIEH